MCVCVCVCVRESGRSPVIIRPEAKIFLSLPIAGLKRYNGQQLKAASKGPSHTLK